MSWIEKKRCESCGKALRRFSNSNCSMACRDWSGRTARSRARLDALMEKYHGTECEYLRDIYLTMADQECGTLKALTNWNQA